MESLKRQEEIEEEFYTESSQTIGEMLDIFIQDQLMKDGLFASSYTIDHADMKKISPNISDEETIYTAGFKFRI